MNPKYFKDKIYTELNESCEYMKKAIDCLKSYPKWSNTFVIMSEDRYSHAEELYRMFMELYLELPKGQETYFNSLRDAIIEMMSEKTRTIDSYKVTYDLIFGSLEPKETDNGDTTD